MKRVVAILLLLFSCSSSAVAPKNILESIFRKLDRVRGDTDAVFGKVCNIQKNTVTILEKVGDIPSSSTSLLDGAESSLCNLLTKVEVLSGCIPTPISGPGTISAEGSYCVTGNITGALTIAASNVSLDLSGFTISEGVSINGGLDQVTVENGVLQPGASGDALLVNGGSSNITAKDLLVRDAIRGINFNNVTGGMIANVEMTSNTTGLELDHSHKITVKDCVASCNTHAGFDLLSSTTCCFENCKALSTGEGNTNEFDNNVFGFVATDGYGNIFERCIANGTQALSTTDSSSVVAGFALRGDEGCSKIIECESANATTSPDGLTVPYGIKLDYTYTDFEVTVTGYFGSNSVRDGSWSPDGKYVAALISNPTAGTGDSLQILAFDSNESRLTPIAGVFGSNTLTFAEKSIAWHPSGSCIAVVNSGITGGTGDALQILTFDRANQTLTPIAGVAANRGQLEWSADGRFLLYGDGITDQAILFRFDAVSQLIEQVDSFSSAGNLRAIAWAPDSKRFLVFEEIVVNDNNIRIFQVDSTGFSQLSITNTTQDDGRSACWSCTGKYIAVGYIAGSSLEIYAFDNETNTLSLITTLDRGVNHCIWTCDDAYLFIESEGLLFIAQFDPSDQTVTEVYQFSYDGAFYGVSPDGAHLLTQDSVGLNRLTIHDAYQFVSKNVIMNNTVYCNSGGSCPQGVGISGSSIQNMIIGNTCYSNPIPSSTGPIVGSNYQFVTNVFNSLFGQAPSTLQNISLGGCEPICQPEDVAAISKKLLHKLCVPIPSQLEAIDESMADALSLICDIQTKVDELLECHPVVITTPFTITESGVYCLGNTIAGTITIAASDVALDLNNYNVTGGIGSTGVRDQITIKNGSASDIELEDITALTIQNVQLVGNGGDSGLELENVDGGVIENCESIGFVNGFQIDRCQKIVMKNCTAASNTNIGFDLSESSTCCLQDCKALGTGEGNITEFNNNVFGFVSEDGYGNIFERCIANATQALSTTDSDSLVAGFALRGSEGCTKIIECESANATTSRDGLTVPYGILLEAELNQYESIAGAISVGSRVRSVSWSPDGKYVAIGGDLFSAVTGDETQVIKFDCSTNSYTPIAGALGADGIVLSVSWSPDGRYVAVGGIGLTGGTGDVTQIIKFDRFTNSYTPIAGALGADGTVHSVSWSSDGKYVAVGGNGLTGGTGDVTLVIEFDRSTNSYTPIAGALGVDGSVHSVSWSPDGKYVAVGGNGLTGGTGDVTQIIEFDRSTNSYTPIAGTFGVDGTVLSVSWSSDGKYVAVGGNTDLTGGTGDVTQIIEFDRFTNSYIPIAGTLGVDDSVRSVSWSSDGKYVAVGGDPGLTGGNVTQVIEFDRSTNSYTPIAGTLGVTDSVYSVEWSPDGKYVAIGGEPGLTGGNRAQILTALSFPSKNVIKNNTVYCNSGGNCPQGVGISGSSIQNMIIGNTCYSNPIPSSVGPIVSSNYQFVTNVFDQRFGTAPIALQNISLDGCDPIFQPEDSNLLAQQLLYKVCTSLPSQLDLVSSQLDHIEAQIGGCTTDPISSAPITIAASGSYCVANNVTGDITITASDVVLDLNRHQVTGSVIVNSSLDQITIENGIVDADGASDGIVVNAGSERITIDNVVIKNALRGVNFENVTGGAITGCEMTLNTTGLELDGCAKINVQRCVASCNTHAGYCLLSSSTCCFENCKALSTGEGNIDEFDNNVFGFVSTDGYGNIFEHCIANSTQALSTTDSNSLVAGFALRGDEGCSKIIECESANATVNENGVTVPYGIWLEATVDQFESITGALVTRGFDPSIVVNALEWSPDGKYVALGGVNITDGTGDETQIFSYDRVTNTYTPIAGLFNNAVGGDISEIAWSPDGQYVAVGGSGLSGGNETQILSFDRVSNSYESVVGALGVTGGVLSVSWSPDGQYVAVGGSGLSGGNDTQILSFDRSTNSYVSVAGALTGFVSSVSWSPDGQYVAVGGNGLSGGNETQILSFDRSTNSYVSVAGALGGDGNVSSVSWSPDGQYVAVGGNGLSGGNETQILSFDRSANSYVSVAGALAIGSVGSVAWSPDGQYVAVGGNGLVGGLAQILSFDRATNSYSSVAGTLDIAGSLNSVSWSPDGAYVVVGGNGLGGGGGDNATQILTGLQFPSKNVIKDNTVYCNSGGSCPQGVGISGSSIQNMIIGNTAYSNPIPRTPATAGVAEPLVASNYQFVTNVFDQRFGTMPSDLQNKSLNGCETITAPKNMELIQKQNMFLVQSIIDLLLSHI